MINLSDSAISHLSHCPPVQLRPLPVAVANVSCNSAPGIVVVQSL